MRRSALGLASPPVARDAPDPDALARASAGVSAAGDGRRTCAACSGGASRETWAFDLVDRRRRASTRSSCAAIPARTRPASRPRDRVRAARSGRPRAACPCRACACCSSPTTTSAPASSWTASRARRSPAASSATTSTRPPGPRLAAQCGEIAARIHAVDTADAARAARAWAPPSRSSSTARRSTRSANRIPRSSSGCAGSPTARPAAPPAPALVHGDFRNGNFIVGPDGIRAVLDWELAHLGDPIEDLGWLCVKSWRFGVADKLVGGFGDVAELLDAYAARGRRARSTRTRCGSGSCSAR